MTWEQEMKEQAHFLAEEWAPVMAQELAQELAQDMAKDMAKDMAEEIAEEKSLETAKNFLKNGIPAEMVAKCTELPLEKILKLKSS